MSVCRKTKQSAAPSPTALLELSAAVARLEGMDIDQLRLQWRNHLSGSAPAHLPRWLLMRVLAYRMQADVLGDLDPAILRMLRAGGRTRARPFSLRMPSSR